MKLLCFYVGLGALLTHELDAMTHTEWRVLPLLRSLPDEPGRDLFVLAHVPLFALVIGLVASLHEPTRQRARFAVSVFLIVHAGLHALYTGADTYTFQGAISNGLIYGAALLGAVYLWLDRKHRSAR